MAVEHTSIPARRKAGDQRVVVIGVCGGGAVMHQRVGLQRDRGLVGGVLVCDALHDPRGKRCGHDTP
jgi:hypothetical protein